MRSVFALLFASGLLCSGNTTFGFNFGINVGHISGFVETDGTLGTLATGNVVDWNLLLNNGSSTFDLLGPLSGNNSQVEVFGGDLSETASLLSFNFSGGDSGFVLFQAPTIGSGSDFVCFHTATLCGGSSASGDSLCLTGCPGNALFAAVTGVGTAPVVPEPSSFVLLSLGAGALIARSRFRRRQKPERLRPAQPVLR